MVDRTLTMLEPLLSLEQEQKDKDGKVIPTLAGKYRCTWSAELAIFVEGMKYPHRREFSAKTLPVLCRKIQDWCIEKTGGKPKRGAITVVWCEKRLRAYYTTTSLLHAFNIWRSENEAAEYEDTGTVPRIIIPGQT